MNETMTKETLDKVDDNNSKAKEIVKSVIDLLVNDDTETDPIVLLDAAADYLNDNDKIFNAIM